MDTPQPPSDTTTERTPPPSETTMDTTKRNKRSNKNVEVVLTKSKANKKKQSKSDSLNAPYIKLTPLDDDDDCYIEDTAMILDDDVGRQQSQASHRIKDPNIHCIYCQDIGSYIWRCTGRDCGIPVCVSKAPGDHGCIDASPNDVTGVVTVTESTFLCPQCHRAEERRIMLRIASRRLKSGNHRPSVMRDDFQWLANMKYEGNLLIFVNTHSDTATGNLVVAGNAENPQSLPMYQLLKFYLGEHLKSATQAIAKINKTTRLGPYIRGLVICSCGSTGRVTESVNALKQLVECDIFDFVLVPAGVSTMDTTVVPAINRFLENVFVYDMKIWDALLQSFGEDKHVLNSTPIMLSFADMQISSHGTRKRSVDTRVIAYSNLKDGRPWGFDIYQCRMCNEPAHNLIFHPDGKQFYGKEWLQTKMKYRCLKCKAYIRRIPTPSWIHVADSQNYGRVWYNWPLTLQQRQDLGMKH
ncbi:hypothetical protein AZE42_07311 [Rhizopogon vesiculosus]|uniref:Uncharacterized protein n=1 Tax=Rhizopogon vesiculosus TaxID=180088 RepID=A0A1J8RF15_9AGAM|nr:hypothetical protein AZE42_07311 [Rhizopogon vesiculosus]